MVIIMNTDLYLKRINFQGEPKTDYATLKQLQYKHFLSVPYENIDIIAKKPLKLDSESLFNKIVLDRRGGYCFELNGAFGSLLRALGFSVTDCMARFLKGENKIPMRRHRVLKTQCDDGIFLCDVGVGIVSPYYPVKLDFDEIQQIGNEQYKLTRDDFFGTVLHQCYEGVWDRFFAFTEEPQLDIDYIMPSFYCENHPQSIFNKEDMLAILSPFGGKNTVSGANFSYWDKNGKHKTIIENEKMRKEIFLEFFGIDLR